MTDERYNALMNWDGKGPELKLTPEEMDEGWHWCGSWDFLLVGPGMDAEIDGCLCALHGKWTKVS